MTAIGALASFRRLERISAFPPLAVCLDPMSSDGYGLQKIWSKLAHKIAAASAIRADARRSAPTVPRRSTGKGAGFRSLIVMGGHDRTIFENDTSYEFLTSDNPSAIIPKDHLNQLCVRVLPLSPRLCLSSIVDLDNAGLDDVGTDITKLPRGTLNSVRIDCAHVKNINELIVLAAEDTVITSGQNHAIWSQRERTFV
jgi:Protein of unknown function (DUF4238)